MADQDDYLLKAPSSARMGKAAEYLVAAACILASRGELNVATSLVDDEGVDLVFHRRGSYRFSASLKTGQPGQMAEVPPGPRRVGVEGVGALGGVGG